MVHIMVISTATVISGRPWVYPTCCHGLNGRKHTFNLNVVPFQNKMGNFSTIFDFFVGLCFLFCAEIVLQMCLYAVFYVLELNAYF